jgi:2-(1,2-epoxy-1,2-dihydrophenyl)acetyl-CoA isomerase
MKLTRIKYTASDGLAHITIANEARHNALDAAFCAEFAKVSMAVVSDPSIKLILIDAQGSSFCVGGDLDDFLENRRRVRAHVSEMAANFHTATAHLHRAVAPVVIAVNGMAAGGGFSLVLNADIAIAKRSAKLCAAYTKTGLSPDGGGTWFLPRLVGLQRAFDIFATNPVLTADEAFKLGMIARVVDDDAFGMEVQKLVAQLLAMPDGALGALKQLLRKSAGASLEEQLVNEAIAIGESAARPSTLAGLDEFVARRAKKV